MGADLSMLVFTQVVAVLGGLTDEKLSELGAGRGRSVFRSDDSTADARPARTRATAGFRERSAAMSSRAWG